MGVGIIESGIFGDAGCTTAYRCEWLGKILVERVIWRPNAPVRTIAQTRIVGPGYVWYRFWLTERDQIVERYYDDAGEAVGTRIDVCGPLVCAPDRCWTTDLLLDLWIDGAGQVTLLNEPVFDAAVRAGTLSAAQAGFAERHVRELTAEVARGSFPPPLVRNWRVDRAQLRQSGSS